MLRNRKGVSLVEVMIALVILLLVFLALMQTALVSIDSNLRNLLRDEAVLIAEERMQAHRNLPFLSGDLTDTNVTTNSPGNFVVDIDVAPFTAGTQTTIQRNFRNIPATFTPTRRIDNIDSAPNNKRIEIKVSWRWKGEPYEHNIASIKRR